MFWVRFSFHFEFRFESEFLENVFNFDSVFESVFESVFRRAGTARLQYNFVDLNLEYVAEFVMCHMVRMTRVEPLKHQNIKYT